jgi:biopolymer transport protein ExbD
MITSTLIAPNAIKLLLPSSSSKTMAKQTVTVYINEQESYFIEEAQVNEEMLEQKISENLAGQSEGTIVLRADKTVPIQRVVSVIDAVNLINQHQGTKHKVILATLPK